MSFKVIAVVYDKKHKPEIVVPAKSAIKEISRYEDIAIKENPTDFYKGIDAVICYGGDGLLLNTANKIAQYDIPIIGVNYGRVGYLCKIKPISEDVHLLALFDIIDDIHDNKLKVYSRTRISAEINDVKVMDALNEISIGGINRTVYLDLHFRTDKLYSLKSTGDGIIFSTQTGSTAYNVNAGGSVLLADVFSVVANNSIFQSNILPVNTKSLIASIDTQFKVKIVNKNENNLPYIVADGQAAIKLDRYDTVTIKKSYYSTKFIDIGE